jgi:hypothetical protein
MKATFPIHYAVSYIPAKCSNNRYVYFASEATVEFRSVPRDAVRTVMRAGKLPQADREAPDAWHFKDPLVPRPDGGMREIVRFEDELWIEAVPVAETIEGLEKNAGKGTPFLPKYSGEALLRNTSHHLQPCQQTRIYSDRYQIERMERKTLRVYKNDGGDAMRQRLQRTADAFIEIDGMLYARCREPMLRIGGRYSEKSIEFCGPPRQYKVRTQKKYAESERSVFDEERAMTWSLSESAAGISEWKRTESETVRPLVIYEVLDPEILTACPHVASFLYLATCALRSLWANPMALRHGVLEPAIELRDALGACGQQITPRLRRAVEEVARIPPLAEDDATLWRRRAEGRPRMKTYNGQHHSGNDLPLTRASQIVTHAADHTKATEFATRALRRLEMRNQRLSWEERALELNSFAGDGIVSYELLSSQAVVQHAEALGVRPEEAIRAARDDGAPAFAVRSGMDCAGPRLIAVIDEAPDGSLSIRSILNDNASEAPAAVELLEQHLAAAAPGAPTVASGETGI